MSKRRRNQLLWLIIIGLFSFILAFIHVPLPRIVNAFSQSLIQSPAIVEEPQPTTYWPLTYLPQDTKVNSEFSLSRKHPISNVYTRHNGIDLNCAIGTPLLSAESGTVSWIDDPKGWGKAILIIGDRPGIEFLYAHADTRDAALKNSWISGGTPIGTCGSTGASTGPHLHFELIINNEETNPRQYLEKLGLLPADTK